MDAPRDDDDGVHLQDIHNADYRRKLRERGKPHGEHIKPDDDMANAPKIDQAVALAEVMSDLRDEMRKRDKEISPPKTDWWKYIVGGVSLIIGVLGIIGSAWSVVASNQKLIDKIEGMDIRLGIVEKRQTDNMPRLEAQIQENKLQDQRFQNMVEAASDERKARQDADVEERKARTEIIAMISRLTDKVGDLDKEQAVQKDRQGRGRTELLKPERDAQMQGPTPR